MFERFNERTRKVMTHSRNEALRLGSEYIGTEHILLGIILEGGGVAAKVLKNLSVDLKRLRQQMEKLIAPPTSPAGTPGQLPFSPRAKRAIELAGEAAGLLGHAVIGTEHLLLGLLKEGEGIAARALANLGLKPDDIRDIILEVLGAEVQEVPTLPSEAQFGCTLMALGLITEEQLRKALVIQVKGGGALADILVEQGFVPEEAMPVAIGWYWALRAASGRGG